MAVDPVSLAITVALTAANMAMTASQKIEGPRVKGTPGTVGDYGTPLNYFLGTRLLSCPCFFAKPITEVKKKRKGKGGKQVSYTGFGSMAIHVADHGIDGILQVWFDNHLVYDNTGSEEKIYPLASDYELEAHMRVYLGTETQDPDPDMLAYIEERDGAGTCPAYRGTSYIYFEGIPLEMLGNRYPDVKVLAAENGTLEVAGESDIDFVGGQVIHDSAEGTHAFALTGGLAAAPAADDTVLILAIQSGQKVGSWNPPAMAGYDTLAEARANDPSGVLDMTLSLQSKRMGVVPDTDFTATTETGIFSDPVVGWIITVWRGVHEDVLDSAPAILSEYIGTINEPDPLAFSFGGTINPGVIGSFLTASEMVSITVALKSESGEQAMIMAMGAKRNDFGTTEWGAGNLTEFLAVHATADTGATAGLAWGETYLIGQGSTLAELLTFLSVRAGLEPDEYDYSLVAGPDHAFDGYNWSQSSGNQADALCDLFDVDMRPHEFKIQAWPRGSASEDTIPSAEFVSGEVPYTLPDKSDSSLPQRVFLTFADSTAEQNPNVAMPQGGEFEGGEISIDMQTLALAPTRAQQLTERRQRRERFGRISAEMALTRQQFALEPGDVFTPSFDGEPMTMRCTKLTIAADGTFPTEWQRDDPAIADTPGTVGAPAAGYIPDTIPDPVASLGYVLDTALLADADDQTAPLVYLAAGPDEPGVWTGADYALSDTGDLDSYAEGWDGISSEFGSIIGETTGALADALPWVPDMGSSVEVTINAGELTAATLDDLVIDGALNLAAVKSGDGWELVQFMTPTLTGPLTYTLTGFLRGVRGTEWAMAGHAPADVFILLDNAKLKTLGAGEIGDEDFYVVSTTGQAVDQDEAFAVDYTGASHKPYSPVHGELTFDTGVTDDITIDATRRTRIGGATLDGQDVPLGEASESWAADIYDGVTFKRTITGVALPLTYTAGQQTTDFGAPVITGFEVNLYQVDPTLSLRGYPLALAA